MDDVSAAPDRSYIAPGALITAGLHIIRQWSIISSGAEPNNRALTALCRGWV